jgi:kumamolisin
MAGLVALLNQQSGKPTGFWNSTLYSELNTKAVRDITIGNNGTYEAAQGWDACTASVCLSVPQCREVARVTPVTLRNEPPESDETKLQETPIKM